MEVSETKNMKDFCNTCGFKFGDGSCYRQSFGNRKWLATLGDDGEVLQECCELCAQEAEDEAMGDDE